MRRAAIPSFSVSGTELPEAVIITAEDGNGPSVVFVPQPTGERQTTVTPADRAAAWPFRPEGYGPSDRGDWDRGLHDQLPIIQALAAQRTTETPSQELERGKNIERERCARIAEIYGTPGGYMRDAGKAIAVAIRGGIQMGGQSDRSSKLDTSLAAISKDIRALEAAIRGGHRDPRNHAHWCGYQTDHHPNECTCGIALAFGIGT